MSGFRIVVLAYGESGNPLAVLFLKKITIYESVDNFPELLLCDGEISAGYIDVFLTAEAVKLIHIPFTVFTGKTPLADIVADLVGRITAICRSESRAVYLL